MYISREDARGVAGVAAATPKFQVLLYKMVLKISKKNLIHYAGYTNFKFLTSSLPIAEHAQKQAKRGQQVNDFI